MDAWSAPNATARAAVALEMCCRIKPHPEGYGLCRPFWSCFEMHDGDAVIAAGLVKLRRSARYRAAVRAHLGSGIPTVWGELVKTWQEVSVD